MVIVVVSMGRDGGRNGGHAVSRTVSTGVGAVCHSELGAQRSSVFSLYASLFSQPSLDDDLVWKSVSVLSCDDLLWVWLLL